MTSANRRIALLTGGSLGAIARPPSAPPAFGLSFGICGPFGGKPSGTALTIDKLRAAKRAIEAADRRAHQWSELTYDEQLGLMSRPIPLEEIYR